MSEQTNGTPDISKVISILMENPDILERISSLVKEDKPSAAPMQKDSASEAAAPLQIPEVGTESASRARRHQLLGALKPYVKKERAQAIDSVMAIADIVDMMRRK